MKMLKTKLVCIWHIIKSQNFQLLVADKKGINTIGFFPKKWFNHVMDAIEDIVIEHQRENSK